MRRLREHFNEPGTLFQLARLGVVALLLGGLGLSGAAGNGAATRWVGGALVAASLVLLAVAIRRLRR